MRARARRLTPAAHAGNAQVLVVSVTACRMLSGRGSDS